ncbi:MAG: RagB/SusD family nutrient uptake outer membrane protein [Candidatus Pseudobacter hemicellulosilyticus]|uniref:RagB/SusD family nutrient uptake outer membrane protein n=1 Tax=Candidatus Pseudobacter hemicellulosilyticus TaxID=3121375 RepID=A0AAJ5WRF9_9BACT|nr:MAG: RagB/SusD family nutrient uptake outer membrane protein [Pseudobacter sp.]
MHILFNKRYRVAAWGMILLVAGSLSCNKLLEIPSHPDDKLSDDRAFSDSANVMSALAGIYSNLKVGNSGAIFSGALTFSAGMYADELQQPGVGGASNEFVSNELRPDNGAVSNLWVSPYTGLYQVNDFLKGVTDNPNISTTFQQQVKGEALVTRALYYFQLVNLFGAVPYVVGTDYKTNAVLPRSSADSIYGLIISDLTTAAGLLKAPYPSAGRMRPNQHVAQAFLAKVYLYRKQWKLAADMASQVIGNGIYQFAELDKTFLEGSVEAIWQMPSTLSNGQMGEANYFVPASTAPSYELTEYQLTAFEENDRRKSTWTRTTTINNVSYTYPFKYRNRDISATPKECLMFFRLSEQYLIRAEANAQQNLLDTARADLNRIRAKAGLDISTAVSKEAVLLAIEHERQTEMFCELGQRWFDLKRTGRANAVLGAIKPKWELTDTLFPVPLTQLQNNIYLDQNEGYY